MRTIKVYDVWHGRNGFDTNAFVCAHNAREAREIMRRTFGPGMIGVQRINADNPLPRGFKPRWNAVRVYSEGT